jgi:hypothetical protein
MSYDLEKERVDCCLLNGSRGLFVIGMTFSVGTAILAPIDGSQLQVVRVSKP